MPSLEDMQLDPYAALGVNKWINASCHWTTVGGTLEPDVVLDAIRAAAANYVDVMELQKAAGRIIAEYTHAEDGYIVSGCAAGMLVGTAAVLTGTDMANIQALPHLTGTGMKSRVIANRFPREKTSDGREYINYGYAQAVRTTGIEFDEVGGDEHPVSAEELDAAFGADTAMVYWGTEEPPGHLTVEEVAEISHSHGVPVLVDNSNHLPPRENLWRYIEAGGDLVAFSGGKGIQGPQGSGILAGRADLIEAVAMQSAPSHGIGRVCKVSKEEIIGQLTALIWWAEGDPEERMSEHFRKSQQLNEQLSSLTGISTDVRFPDFSGRPYPTVIITFCATDGRTGTDILNELAGGNPPILAMADPGNTRAVRLDVRLCEDKDIDMIGRRLNEIFRR